MKPITLRWCLSWLILTISLCTQSLVLSQVATGRIYGRVVDQTGSVVAGAIVTLTDEVRGATKTIHTDEDGVYQFSGLLPGKYSIRANASGFNIFQVDQIVVVGNQAFRCDVILSTAGTSEVITVSAGDALVQTSSAELSNSLDQQIRIATQPWNTEAYDSIVENSFLSALNNPLSTFSIDVDTASYSNVRRFLTEGDFPPPDAVRIEELINYFPYTYAQPKNGHPFNVQVDVTDCPWKPEHHLMRIGLKGKELSIAQRPPSNLVFLLDVSGSMEDENKLPLVKKGIQLLVEQLTEKDQVAMVVYAGSSGLVLPPTPGSQKKTILDAIEHLEAGGSTNGGEGIELAYKTALAHFVKGGNNRVILATDGDFNVGVTSEGELVRLIEEKAKDGVFLSVLGFGMGNYKDSILEQLSDKGNGNYAYIDTLNEARKVLVEQMSGTLITIAKDVKLQIEFNPAKVLAYRLVGYENRLLRTEDFQDDTKDAGDIGAGHTVTALYELVPVGTKIKLPRVEALKYQIPGKLTAAAKSRELLTVRLRYKQPTGKTSTELVVPVNDQVLPFEKSADDFQFAASVAGFGMLLRDSEYKGIASFSWVKKIAQETVGKDPLGYRKEFVQLVSKAIELKAAESSRR